MAASDRIGGMSSIAAGNSMTIQPGSGVEWVVHNVYHANSVELYICDSAGDLLFDSHAGSGAWLKYGFQLTNGHYLKAKNVGASAALISFDGVQTK